MRSPGCRCSFVGVVVAALLVMGLLATGCGRSVPAPVVPDVPAVPADSAASAPAPPGAPAVADTPTAHVAGKVIFLHHSTGAVIWNGGVPEWFARYNAEHNTRYQINEQVFPKDAPYGWENYPYDYANIWVVHAGPQPFKEEPTLEMLTQQYEVIVFKHCFPVSDIGENATSNEAEASADKTIATYQTAYHYLKAKMRQFPPTKFIVWTGAAQVRRATTPEQAERAREFFRWVVATWDEPGDNIFVWDFRQLETEGGLYLKDNYAAGRDDSHPNENFARRVAPLFCRRLVAVLTGEGDRVPRGDLPAVF